MSPANKPPNPLQRPTDRSFTEWLTFIGRVIVRSRLVRPVDWRKVAAFVALVLASILLVLAIRGGLTSPIIGAEKELLASGPSTTTTETTVPPTTTTTVPATTTTTFAPETTTTTAPGPPNGRSNGGTIIDATEGSAPSEEERPAAAPPTDISSNGASAEASPASPVTTTDTARPTTDTTAPRAGTTAPTADTTTPDRPADAVAPGRPVSPVAPEMPPGGQDSCGEHRFTLNGDPSTATDDLNLLDISEGDTVRWTWDGPFEDCIDVYLADDADEGLAVAEGLSLAVYGSGDAQFDPGSVEHLAASDHCAPAECDGGIGLEITVPAIADACFHQIDAVIGPPLEQLGPYPGPFYQLNQDLDRLVSARHGWDGVSPLDECPE